MKTGFDFLDKVYKILNVATVTDVINGRIYRRWKPTNSELQDMVISTLPTKYGEDIQSCTVVVNNYCKNLHFGLSNEVKLREITDAVISVLEAYTQADGIYFNMDIVSENTMKDTDQPTMSYTSLRVNCILQKKV